MLLVIEAKRYKVCAVTTENELAPECPAFEFLKQQSATAMGQVKGFKALFKRYAESGRQKVGIDLLHHANAEHEIYEFIKGQMRIFCFFDGEDVILTHGALKKTQKASTSEIRTACGYKESYYRWKNG